MAKPLTDYSEDELKKRLRTMYEAGNYITSPNDILRELRHRQASRHARISMIASVVSALVATIAVVLSALAFIGAQP